MPNVKPIAPQLLIVGLLIVANGLIASRVSPGASYGAALLLAALTGWLWALVLAPRLPRLETVLLAAGLGLALTVLAAMLAVYLPGAISVGGLLAVLNGAALAGLALSWGRMGRFGAMPLPGSKYLWLLAVVVLLALALRLPRLGYAEFHEDEAEALMLGVRLLQGEDYALFLHRKGPAQMLLPVSFWLLANQITETLARLPFALSSLASVIALFALGRRWFGFAAGLLAALLWAINGYSIAFGRMVQYQALIFFAGVLGVLALYLAARQRSAGLQVAGALLLAVALLAHFDALLLLPAAAWLWAAGFVAIRRESSRRAMLGLGLSLGLFIAILAAFYLPYILDPEFQNTTAYLTESRVKPGLLYNNLDTLRRLDRDYSSRFYLPLLALGLLGAVLSRGAGALERRGDKQTSRNTQHAARTPFYVLRFTLLLTLATTLFWPSLWQWGDNSLAVLPWLLLGGLCFLAAPTLENRAAWLLFGAPLIGYGFLVDDPRTHLYIIYPGAVLLAGAGWARLGNQATGQIAGDNPAPFAMSPSRKIAMASLLAVAVIWLALIATYETAIFLPTESTFARLRDSWEDSAGEWLYNDIPRPREYFGYPKREGWKAIGSLRAEGRFPGDFRSVNEEFITPIWYNFGQARSCYDTPDQLFIRLAGLDSATLSKGYAPGGAVTREGEHRLDISSREGIAPAAAESFAVEDFIARFDALATPQQFSQQNQPAQGVGVQFGGLIEFRGFDLPQTTAAPGDTLALNLYWRALAAPGQNYRAFAHLTDGTTLWAQQDDDPACRLPTSVWREGQNSTGQFRLHINPDTPPGRYPLIIGLYDAATLERLKISGGAGVIGDDFLWLGDVEIY